MYNNSYSARNNRDQINKLTPPLPPPLAAAATATRTATTVSKTPHTATTTSNISSASASASVASSRSGCLTTQTTPKSARSDSRFHLNSSSAYSTCSVLTPTKVADPSHLESCNPAITTHMTLLSHRRRRLLQRHACLLSILAAFAVGLVLGVLAPMLGISNFFVTSTASPTSQSPRELGIMTHLPLLSASHIKPLKASSISDHHEPDPTLNRTHTAQVATRPPSDFPTIYELQQATQQNTETPSAGERLLESQSPYSVAFVKEQSLELPAEEIFRNAFQVAQVDGVPDAMIVKKLDAEDRSIKQFRVERLGLGRYRKGPEKRLSKPNIKEKLSNADVRIVPLAERIVANTQSDKQQMMSIIKSDIYWGDLVERALPHGFSEGDAKDWNDYVTSKGVVTRFEPGCGRMQNRLVIFADGTRACARYRQNTDQIQGEIFSFYLGQLLNITNLAPSAATVVDLDSQTWSTALPDITQAQWKQQRPVVLTRWLPDLEPAGIPQPFQPLERHLNKFDVWNITLTGTSIHAGGEQGLLLQRLANATQHNQSPSPSTSASASASSSSSSPSSSDSDSVSDPSSSLPLATIAAPTPAVLQRLVELAQWSDLIVFDYLIANLDRVVNNLYNFQWNADIMAAPAHNLARQTDTQLLVFLDNESGLLHGYRLLKKYEAYHGLLLDNLCVFRQPTIDALRQLRSDGAGRKLRQIFEHTTSNAVRDVLPSLPDKSIKILVDRIDRILGQVQKCKDLLSSR